MDAIERNIIFLQRANKFWGISVISLLNHLYGKTGSKKLRPLGVLTKEDEISVAWVLNMQECGLSITLEQLKWKVVEVTQT
jgi:hypothetical protein